MRKPRTGYEIKKDATTKALRALIASNGREEYQIHCAIVEMIRRSKLPGVVFWHTENERKRDYAQQSAFAAMGGLAGVSDIIVSTRDGRMCFIEVKSSAGTLSEDQESFLAAMELNGHRTAVVRSLVEAAHYLALWNVIRNVQVAA